MAACALLAGIVGGCATSGDLEELGAELKKNPQFDIIRELMKTAGSETPPSASYEEVRGLMKDALAEILSGADYVQIMQDLNEEANRLHMEALAQLKE